MWAKYDLNATGFIARDDLKNLMTDILLKEIREVEKVKNDED